MGNSKSKDYSLIENKKFATEYELNNREVPPYPNLVLQRFTGSGNNFIEAMEDLSELCKKNGIPEPKDYCGNYHCGNVEIVYNFKTATRLNPVIYKKRNGRCFAIIHYPRI